MKPSRIQTSCSCAQAQLAPPTLWVDEVLGQALHHQQEIPPSIAAAGNSTSSMRRPAYDEHERG